MIFDSLVNITFVVSANTGLILETYWAQIREKVGRGHPKVAIQL
jgi:hypothetical protein